MGLHLFGLTGGIATGKSTVARFLAARGVTVLDADTFAREVVAPGTEGLAEVVAAFGPAVLAPNGSLDRRALAAVVFRDTARRRVLESITHPRIRAATLRRARELAAQGTELAAYEAALLVENGLANAFRPLVVATVTPADQLARLQARDGFSAQQALARVEAQMPLAQKEAAADHVIDTTPPLADVSRRTDEVLAAICGQLGLAPERYGLPAPALKEPGSGR
ncbi:MAG: dephospho-CoA kinase [Polyangiaceae bacterium]|jgi:dephospho-CoA kinase|nr:dephospho-CoA kinase [Polyangiaceae bacterium]